MADKHPERSAPILEDLPAHVNPSQVQIHLTETFRGLRRRAGTGLSGNRNEYMRALVGTFGDAAADDVMQLSLIHI